MKTIHKTDFARRLRRYQTEAERRLWFELRKRRPAGCRFVRQSPVGPFIVDFLCRERGLVIEVDGATHGEDRDVAYDARRTQFLASLGLVVIRVNNHDVFTNMSGVMDGILAALEGLPRR
jgi:very-short-patch-repair endonuclease